MKVCRTCGVLKALDCFSKKPDTKDGLQTVCKVCAAEYRRSWAKRNAEKLAEYNKTYREKNRAEIAEHRRERYLENQGRNIAAARRYREENKAKTLAWASEYRKKNADRTRATVRQWRSRNGKAWSRTRRHIDAEKAANRRAAHRKATPPWADRSAMRDLYEEARRLTSETGVPHHVDHVVPLVSKKVSGLHAHTNLAVLPAKDNLVKSNRHWPDQP